MSGVDLSGRHIRKGAADAISKFVRDQGGSVPTDLAAVVDGAASRGATPLVVADGAKVAGVVVLEDILKPSMKARFDRLRKMGLRTVMITGDNPLTAETIAKQAGVDDFLAQATPENKLEYIRKQQADGKLVAMMGDGTNDAPALAQADVAVAMNAGTQAAKEAGNMVDLDSDPTKLIEVVEIGKQLLMTRGALTTFSVANDVAKYFAIIPALFAGTLPWLKTMDIMHLHSPTSAILSAVIFNALIIPALIPIALKGVKYQPLGADALLRRNLLIWGAWWRGSTVYRHQVDRRGHGRSACGRVSMELTMRYISKSILLLLITVVLVCGIYPAAVWAVGRLFFPFQAEGSLLIGPDGQPVGSKLIAQPFTKDEYFQPRPSAASYDASASASSTLAPSNYALRDRVARTLGPIVKYRSGTKAGQLVAPDVEAWFQQDRYQGSPGIVASGPICTTSSLRPG